jgi:hypothetical protein
VEEGASVDGPDSESEAVALEQGPQSPPLDEHATPPPRQLRLAPRPAPPSHITRLPGVTVATRATGSSNIGPVGESWKKRAGRLVAVMWNTKTQKEFKPFLEEAQEWLEGACMQLAVSAGGVCGPIEMNALATAAWQTAYARYWMHMASENPADMKLFETASRVADAARSNSLAAYDIAVRLARSRPSDSADPLAALIDVTAPSPVASPQPEPGPKGGFADEEEG